MVYTPPYISQACHEAVAEIASVSSTSTVSNASLPSGLSPTLAIRISHPVHHHLT